VSFFLALLDSKADNADELCVAERAEHCRVAEPIREQTQRLSIFNLEGATERFRVGLESLQSNVSIEDCVLPCEATYLNVVSVNAITQSLRKDWFEIIESFDLIPLKAEPQLHRDLSQRRFFGRLKPPSAVARNADHAKPVDVRDQVLEKAKPLCGQAFLPANCVHHVTRGRSAGPRVALGKSCRDRVYGDGGKDQQRAGQQAAHGSKGSGSGYKHPRLQRGQAAAKNCHSQSASQGRNRGLRPSLHPSGRHAWLDEFHGLRISIIGHEGKWPVSTIKFAQL
jgi:hypothetical protein